MLKEGIMRKICDSIEGPIYDGLDPKRVEVSFECPNCKKQVKTSLEEVKGHYSYWLLDEMADGCYLKCPHCQTKFSIC